MLDPQRTPTTMEILVRACLLLLPVLTFVDGSEINLTVKEDDDAILPCSFGTTDITQKTFDWNKEPDKEVFRYAYNGLSGSSRAAQDPQFKNRVDHFPDQLKVGNASIVIRKTKPADSGTYTCIFPHEQPQKRAVIHLTVGAASEPYVTILQQTNDWALLECKVIGAHPNPVVEWWDSDNKTLFAEEPQIIPRGDKNNTFLRTTVTKTGYYRCVSTQMEIHHRLHNDIFVKLNGFSLELVVGLVVGLGVPLMLCVGVIIYMCKTRNNVTRGPSQSNGPSENSASLQPLTKSA